MAIVLLSTCLPPTCKYSQLFLCLPAYCRPVNYCPPFHCLPAYRRHLKHDDYVPSCLPPTYQLLPTVSLSTCLPPTSQVLHTLSLSTCLASTSQILPSVLLSTCLPPTCKIRPTVYLCTPLALSFKQLPSVTLHICVTHFDLVYVLYSGLHTNYFWSFCTRYFPLLFVLYSSFFVVFRRVVIPTHESNKAYFSLFCT